MFYRFYSRRKIKKEQQFLSVQVLSLHYYRDVEEGNLKLLDGSE